MKKNINDILSQINIVELHGNSQALVAGISQDSRQVAENFLFFAVHGGTVDGHLFISKAIEQGASVVVYSHKIEKYHPNILFLRIDQPLMAQTMAQIAQWFYDKPAEKLKLIGITGTNGKTTVATLLHQLFNALGKKSGLISTVENFTGISASKIQSKNTTPDAIVLNQLLFEMAQNLCEYVFMEVSSHGIALNRIYGLRFDIAVFTNITHDHLDFHPTFAQYINTKKKLFDELAPNAVAIVNADDKNGAVMLQNTKAQKITFSLKKTAHFKLKILEQHFDGTLLKIGQLAVWTPLVGDFNASNLLAVYAVANTLNLPHDEILTQISMLKPATGRFDSIRIAGINAIIDYAHTPDALQNVLQTINKIRKQQNLITVIGTGGNRDAAKRPIMAKIAANYSNKVILTSDNPRFENPEKIIDDMYKGLDNEQIKKTLTITNRKQAIHTATMLAAQGDIILIAGKGHENYQEINGKRYPFDDKKIISDILTALAN